VPEQFTRVTGAAALIAQLSEALAVNGSTARIEVRGHTDSDGSELENGPLSQARADAVVRALSATAPDSITLAARGLGVEEPVTTGTSEAEKVLNRRVSLRVLLPPDQTSPGSRP